MTDDKLDDWASTDWDDPLARSIIRALVDEVRRLRVEVASLDRSDEYFRGLLDKKYEESSPRLLAAERLAVAVNARESLYDAQYECIPCHGVPLACEDHAPEAKRLNDSFFAALEAWRKAR